MYLQQEHHLGSLQVRCSDKTEGRSQVNPRIHGQCRNRIQPCWLQYPRGYLLILAAERTTIYSFNLQKYMDIIIRQARVTTVIYQIYQSGGVVDYLNPLSPYVHFFSIHTHNRHMRYPQPKNKAICTQRGTVVAYASSFMIFSNPGMSA